MPFLTVAGITVEVLTEGAAEEQSEEVGSVVLAFSGVSLSSVRAAARVWTFALRPVPQASFDALVAAIRLQAKVTCAGDAMPAGGVLCRVTRTGGAYVYDAAEASTFVRGATLRLREVTPA